VAAPSRGADQALRGPGGHGAPRHPARERGPPGGGGRPTARHDRAAGACRRRRCRRTRVAETPVPQPPALRAPDAALVTERGGPRAPLQAAALTRSGSRGSTHGAAGQPSSRPRQGVPPTPRPPGPAAATDVQRTYTGGHAPRSGGDLAGRPAGGPLERLGTGRGPPRTAGRPAWRAARYPPRDPGPALGRPLAAPHPPPPQRGAGPGAVAGALAGGGAAPGGHAEAGGGTAVRLCRPEAAAAARMGLPGRQWPRGHRRDPARLLDGLRGAGSPPDARAVASGAGPRAVRRLAGVARATASKAVTDCALAHRRARPPQTETGEPHALGSASHCMTPTVTGRQSSKQSTLRIDIGAIYNGYR
jgi:hypothetical protein